MSRQQILDAIRKNKPALVAAPASFQYLPSVEELVPAFIASLEPVGGAVITLKARNEIAAAVQEHYPQMTHIADFVNHPRNSNQALLHDAASIEVAVLEGRLGVAENGAIWLQESDCISRALPFITQHLVLVLEKTKIVDTMHSAYAQIDTTREGFGVFIAGPSKTADIEQSLVIGAHGAKSLLVLLIG
ncbi:LutC/YkgG family protein [Pseudoflavitalea rhizosphaerae]|uniref:LutC/YkgG family protein n=1 Tax=Pseudoflavitalea rhizosphaerae TaxID=1884793 RepID=UPI000F8E8E3F|nr:LUD domain-containing protein [Pseudoflavitalea rhizosphaerae]